MNIKTIQDWEVETPSGWSAFSGIKKSLHTTSLCIVTDRNNLVCSLKHKLKLDTDKWVYAKDLQVGHILFGDIKVIDIIENTSDIEMYDLLDVDYDNEYFTNGILSHNCAFVDRIDSIWGAALPTLSTGGSATLLSTPNGMGNLFHKLWTDAESGDVIEGLEPFNPIKLKWDLHPERDQSWRDQQTSLLGERLAAQECVGGNAIITVRNTETGLVEDITIFELENRLRNE